MKGVLKFVPYGDASIPVMIEGRKNPRYIRIEPIVKCSQDEIQHYLIDGRIAATKAEIEECIKKAQAKREEVSETVVDEDSLEELCAELGIRSFLGFVQEFRETYPE